MKHLFLASILFHSLWCSAQSIPFQKQLNIDSLTKEELKKNEAKQKAASGKPFPSFSIKGKDFLLSNQTLKGKVVFINFWFATCEPCIREFDALNKLYARLKSNKNFAFIAFTYEKEETIKLVKEKYHLQFPIISIDQDECHRLNNGFGFPTNFIVKKDGTIKKLIVGLESNADDVTKMFMDTVYPAIREEL
jgi:peroxiredoxin